MDAKDNVQVALEAVPEELLDHARAVGLEVEDGEVLFSEDQGRFQQALVCLDRWLCVRDGALRMEMRLLKREAPGAAWDCGNEGGRGALSQPLTLEMARQLIDHWGLVMRATEVQHREDDERESRRRIYAPVRA